MRSYSSSARCDMRWFWVLALQAKDIVTLCSGTGHFQQGCDTSSKVCKQPDDQPMCELFCIPDIHCLWNHCHRFFPTMWLKNGWQMMVCVSEERLWNDAELCCVIDEMGLCAMISLHNWYIFCYVMMLKACVPAGYCRRSDGFRRVLRRSVVNTHSQRQSRRCSRTSCLRTCKYRSRSRQTAIAHTRGGQTVWMYLISRFFTRRAHVEHDERWHGDGGLCFVSRRAWRNSTQALTKVSSLLSVSYSTLMTSRACISL